MNNWKDCSICQVSFEGSVLKGLTWRHITLSGWYAAAEHLWMRLSCSDSNFTGYLGVTADLNFCPQRILYLPLPQITSRLFFFLSVVDAFEWSEEVVDALQISHHTSNTDTQTLPVQPTAYNCFCLMHILSVRKKETNLFWNQVLPLTTCLSPSSCDPVVRWKLEIMNWLICRGRFRGGQRRGNGSELSVWDYPDLMGGIKRPMGGNPLSIRADFVTLMSDVILQEPFRRSQRATRWQYIQSGLCKGEGDVKSNFIFNNL